MAYINAYGGGGIPAALKTNMNAVLNKKFGTTAVDYDPNDWPDDVNLLGALEEKTVSAAPIASFSDGADDVPMLSVVAYIPPTLTGINSVNIVQTGKNLFDGYTKGYGVNSSTGEIFANNNGAISGYIPIKPNTAFYVSGLTDTIHSFIAYYKADKTYISRTNGSNRTYVSATTPNECYFVVVYQYANNDTGTIDDVDNLKTQFEIGSSASSYVPYIQPTSYTANLGRTIYGGQADIVNGQGTETFDKIVIDGSVGQTWTMISVSQGTLFRLTVSNKTTTTPTNTISTYYTPVHQAQRADLTISGSGSNLDIIDNRFSSADDFKDWLSQNPITIVYETSTSSSFVFDGQEINSFSEINNLWNDTGNTSVVYRSAGTIVTPTLITKAITANGTYNAADDNADGFSSVSVNVPVPTPLVPTYTETAIADELTAVSSFTISEDYHNFDLVHIVFYNTNSRNYTDIFTTPDILDEIFTVSTTCKFNETGTNRYANYTISGLTWTRGAYNTGYIYAIKGVTFTNCTMTATDIYKRGTLTVTKEAVTSVASLKQYDLFLIAAITATDGSETVPCSIVYDKIDTLAGIFPKTQVLTAYNNKSTLFTVSEFAFSEGQYFMIQGIKFTANS